MSCFIYIVSVVLATGPQLSSAAPAIALTNANDGTKIVSTSDVTGAVKPVNDAIAPGKVVQSAADVAGANPVATAAQSAKTLTAATSGVTKTTGGVVNSAAGFADTAKTSTFGAANTATGVAQTAAAAPQIFFVAPVKTAANSGQTMATTLATLPAGLLGGFGNFLNFGI